ncbi:hypothetical protein [Micromonospora sp. RL09-050-HVF-A]|uniref:hypothetical protein n=1 Tax=Micromonospora sp. RL09-050-HVF-A TaxID=1703433 RepID=UPI001C600D3A|nr:hypothetical protein [Micromonospora sp. RL09-050-HVF-A]MBW4705184.1 hypothetical protein [Micromonospora sp. RL09-050-HVF-A]
MVTALARRADPNLGALSHPAVLERWAHRAKRVTDGLRKDRRRLEKQVADQQHKAVADLAEADDAYAMGCAMEVIASRLREDLRSQVYLRLQQSEKRAARISRLIEAANRVARNEPRLARPVADVCLVHTATCVAAARGDSCAACVPELISRLNAILIAPAPRAPISGQLKPGTNATGTPAKPTARPVVPRLAGPGQSASARWLPTGDRIRTGTVRAAWQVAVTRDDVNRRRCPIPDGTILPSHETRRLRLYFEHLSAATRPQNVTLRQVGGRWQLEGVRWPASLQPGLLVDFTWRTDSTTMTAVTKPLRRPERIDGTEFRHEFDRQVVTRELEPDGDPRHATGPVSVERWVLRTLRILGHLCPQGTATLAEDALVRNCQSLGMPDRMTGQVNDATTNLIKAGRIRKVRGGRDSYGGLWYPARSGDSLVDLIRYQPTVEVLKPQSLAKMGAPAPRSAHQVHGFIRRLPAGAHASDRQMELYEEAVQAAELANRSLDPNRFTFVNKHRREATRGGH